MTFLCWHCCQWWRHNRLMLKKKGGGGWWVGELPQQCWVGGHEERGAWCTCLDSLNSAQYKRRHHQYVYSNSFHHGILGFIGYEGRCVLHAGVLQSNRMAVVVSVLSPQSKNVAQKRSDKAEK